MWWTLLLLFSGVSMENLCKDMLLHNTACPINMQTIISQAKTDNPMQCQDRCAKDSECSHFTLYTLSQSKVSSCALLRSCNTNETSTCSPKPDSVLSPCDSAVSGPRAPPIAEVCCKQFEKKSCNGDILSQHFNVDQPDKCQELCVQTQGCNYFTQYSQDFCQLYTTCDKTEHCTLCNSGPASPPLDKCKEPQSRVTLLIGGSTSTQGTYSRELELVSPTGSCSPDMPEPPIA